MLNVKLGIKSLLLLSFISSNCFYSNTAKAFTVVFDTGQIVNTGSQTEGGITVTYNLSTAGTALDTSQDTSSVTTGDQWPNEPNYVFIGAFSDFNDGNAFQDAGKTIPTGANDIPALVEVDNYINYNFTFSEPVDLTNFRIGDIDYDHNDTDKYHDSIAVIAEKPDGSFSVVSGETVGSDLETYVATLISNPDNPGTTPDYLGGGVSSLIPYRQNDHNLSGQLNVAPTNDNNAVLYDASLQNITGVNVLYWNEKNETSADTSDLMAVAITGEFQATQVPFKFSPSLGLIISGTTIGISKWLKRNKHQTKEKELLAIKYYQEGLRVGRVFHS